MDNIQAKACPKCGFISNSAQFAVFGQCERCNDMVLVKREDLKMIIECFLGHAVHEWTEPIKRLASVLEKK